MAAKRPGSEHDEDDGASHQPTRLEMSPYFGRVSDETLPVTSGHRLAPTVSGFKLVNELALTDPTVSRIHAEVKIEEQRAVVRDLGSMNGTFIDGVRIREGYPRNGSVLRLGKATIRFELLDKQHGVPVSEATRFGTCYFATEGIGAFIETMLGLGNPTQDEVDERYMTSCEVRDVLHLADLTNPLALG